MDLLLLSAACLAPNAIASSVSSKVLARTFIFWTAAVALQQRRTSSFISLTWWLRLKNILIAYACYCTIQKQGGFVTDNTGNSCLICSPSPSLGLSFNSGDRCYIIKQNMTPRALHLLTFQPMSRGLQKSSWSANHLISLDIISFCLLIYNMSYAWCSRACRSPRSQTVGVIFAHVGNSNGFLLIAIENKGTWWHVSSDFFPFIHCFMLL